MVAVRDGASVETTMGFTPTGGLVMGTRTGDLDPGVLLYLLQQQGLATTAVSDLVNRQAGLLAVAETSSDMRDLLGRRAADPRAALAVALFCYQAKKYLGALAAVLGGLDTVVFTGGIGEHAAPVRAEICAGLGFLGIQIDERRNAAHAPVVSADGGAVTVRVIPTDEDRAIAQHTARLLAQQGENAHEQD
jgi:acetate kinase